MKIAVIGGGSAGLAAAIFAGRADRSVEIVIYEGNGRVGKKLLSTGNGRCNLSNEDMSPDKYITHDREFVAAALKGRGLGFVRGFFDGLGIPLVTEEGRVYPRSMRAAAVVDALRFECARQNIRTVADKKIDKIEYVKRKFIIGGETFDRVCLACGGKAAPAMGSDGSGFELAQALGHKIFTPYPSLVQLRTENGEKALKGIRIWAKARAVAKGETLREETGEVQFGDYGLSGIPIMQLSALFEGNMEIFLDLLPELDFAEATDKLLAMAENVGDLTLSDFMSGYFQKNITRRICQQCGIDPGMVVHQMTIREMKRFITAAKALRFRVVGTNSWPAAQTTRGGVDLGQIDPKTMESRRVKGLYFAGEIMDVCGDCGGYNLHWAWVSGSRAGESMATRKISVASHPLSELEV